jgi:hypothetical protein
MQFNLFVYCTVGRRAELEAGMARQRNELYQRMLDEIAEYTAYRYVKQYVIASPSDAQPLKKPLSIPASPVDAVGGPGTLRLLAAVARSKAQGGNA